MEKKYTVGVCALGCRVNLYESEAITAELEKRGFLIRDFSEVNDIYIVNTCAVTGESDRKSRQTIRRALKTNPNGKVLVCGCYSQLFANDVAKIDGVDYIGGSTDKMAIAEKAESMAEQLKKGSPEMNIGDPFTSPFEEMEAERQDRTRAFLKIEDGCNNKCSYCIIPQARGKVRSKPIDAALKEVEKIVANGYLEVALAGIETSAYGQGEGYSLIDLLERLEEVEKLERIRLGSLDPSYLKKNIIDRLANLKKLTPHYHLSLQSGTDKTLNAMRRGYNVKTVEETVSYIREKIPNATFGADIIAGFPGETDADFDETLKFVAGLKLLNSHIFPFSPRPGTEAAARTDQIDGSVKTARSAALQKVCAESKKTAINEFIENKTPLKTLFEREKNGYVFGHTSNYIDVKVKASDNISGKIRDVVLKKYNEKDGLTEGEII